MIEDKRILECPACHKRLVKAELKTTGTVVDICLDGCGGIYFNNKEMPVVLASQEALDEIKALCEGKEFTKPDETEARICPFCESNMVKNYTSYSKEVLIDECYRCGGKFLDGGELAKIKVLDTSEDTKAIMQEVQEIFAEDIKQMTAKNVLSKTHRARNSRSSFFIKLADKFLRR